MYGVKARSLMAVGYALLIGCGARTESFDEELGGSTNNAGAAQGTGGSPSAGSPSAGSPSAGNPSAGAPNPGAGSGGISFGGSGAFPGAGAFPVAGTSGFGAFGGIGVAGSFGGFGAEGGDVNGGSAGTGGFGEVCSLLGATPCEQCVCNQCAAPITNCFSDFGCTLIFACAQQTGCVGLACYASNTCRPVIDQFGGLTGPAMKNVLGLSACALTATNSCGCN